jgi:hypothetical protein
MTITSQAMKKIDLKSKGFMLRESMWWYHDLVLKKDSREAGMTDYKKNMRIYIFK